MKTDYQQKTTTEIKQLLEGKIITLYLTTSGCDDTQVQCSESSLIEFERQCLNNARRSPLFAKAMEKAFPLFTRNGTFGRVGNAMQQQNTSTGIPIDLIPAYLYTEIMFGQVLGVGAFSIVRELDSIELTTPATSPENQHATSVDSGRLGAQQSCNESLLALKEQISERCKRNGDARYAVKYLLLADATTSERIQARVDLAIEVSFLHVLSHPHIIKMRGLFKSETPFHPDYFFVMDCLFGTLEDKTKEWIAAKRDKKSRRAVWALRHCSIPDTNQGIDNLLIERLLVAHDVASVLEYLHTNGVVYR